MPKIGNDKRKTLLEEGAHFIHVAGKSELAKL